jgi:sarcosine oxidase
MLGADVAVVGGGVVGLAVADELLQRGASVVVYEQAIPGEGQSGGEGRIFRHTHEDPRLIALARAGLGLWKKWEDRFDRELLSRDGLITVGSVASRHLALLQDVGDIRARTIDNLEIASRLPMLAPYEGPALLDEDAGVIRVRATISALRSVVGDRFVFDEVLSLRTLSSGTLELRSASGIREFAGAVLCAGRGTSALARSVGVELPLLESAQARLTFRMRANPPYPVSCLLDSSAAFGEGHTYGEPMPGNDAFAIGLYSVPVRQPVQFGEPGDFEVIEQRSVAYVRRALPGLDPQPIGVRHCWVTELPWGADGVAAWEAGNVLIVAGNNLFKHAPALAQQVADGALEGRLWPELRASAKLGRAQPDRPHPEVASPPHGEAGADQ